MWSALALLVCLGSDGALAATIEEEARFRQLNDEIVRLAEKNAWPGVEAKFEELSKLPIDLPVELVRLGAEAARNQGDIWLAYQRLLVVMQKQPEDAAVHEQVKGLRERFGRLTVRRVEARPITLVPQQMPFVPDERLAIEHAKRVLEETGGFDGMLPPGDYLLGSYHVRIFAGLTPVVVQRSAGDGGGPRHR